MCVTFDRATITDTEVCTYAAEPNRHLVAYKNKLISADRAPTAMVLNFPGSVLKTVSGPQNTLSLMADITRDLPLAVRPRLTRGSYGMRSLGGSPPVSVQAYGDYWIVLAQRPADITAALESVPDTHRPRDISKVVEFAGFYMSWAPNQVFMIACTTGRAAPRHPVAVEYQPHDPSLLVAPGLDGHSGGLPVPGDPVHRDFAVAFGIRGVSLPHEVDYSDPVSDEWAPRSIAGFKDNRPFGPNGDYIVRREDLEHGRLTGPELVSALQVR